MKKPTFITFTGADDYTNIQGMIALAAKYPIEWGILFSPKQQGQGRYPSFEFIRRVTKPKHGLRLSAHICGGYSRQLIQLGSTGLENPISAHFDRVQINTSDESADPVAIANWALPLGVKPIMQCRSHFPMIYSRIVQWLFDASGGRGISPATWPEPIPGVMCGYAGGLNPANVAEAVADIGAMGGEYWIDMETGVRDKDDRFDLDLCRQVCEAVYGPTTTTESKQ